MTVKNVGCLKPHAKMTLQFRIMFFISVFNAEKKTFLEGKASDCWVLNIRNQTRKYPSYNKFHDYWKVTSSGA